MHLLKNFKELTVRPKNAQELKGLILQLAVQGKLTAKWRKDNPKVEPASILLKHIQEEKSQLIKEKKIKKEKPLPTITKDEIPYELPERWAWCRLNEVCEYIQRGKSPKYSETPKIPVVSQKCIQWSGFDISRAKFITEESLEKYGEERFLQFGDLLWNSTGNGTIGRVISFPETDFEKVVADSHVTVVRSIKKYVLTDYLWIFTASPLIQNIVVGRVTGSTNQTELGTATVKLMEFSFPPLEEQKEIVKVVETLFNEVEQLEQLTVKRISLKEDFVTSALNQLTTKNAKKEWAFLQEHFQTFFNETTNIKKLRETFLQLAVQGKLTSTWRASHPELVSGSSSAKELLKRIQEEKAKLVKDKKIKKEKTLPPIIKDEIPYELPEGWVWCRVGDLTTIKGGKRIPKGHQLSDMETAHVYIRVTDMKNGTVISNKLKYITDDVFEIIKAYTISKDDLYITIAGTIGDVGVIPEELDNMNLTENAAKLILYQVDKIYLKTLLSSYICQSQFLDKVNQMAQPKLALHRVASTIIPVPPLEEQKAIVQKVNALMGLCDALDQQVQQNQEQSEKLMQSVLMEVFEGKAVEEIENA